MASPVLACADVPGLISLAYAREQRGAALSWDGRISHAERAVMPEAGWRAASSVPSLPLAECVVDGRSQLQAGSVAVVVVTAARSSGCQVRAPSVKTRCASRSPSSGTSEVASTKAVTVARNVSLAAGWTGGEAARADTRTRSPPPLATASSPVAVAPSAVTGESASTWCPATC